MLATASSGPHGPSGQTGNPRRHNTPPSARLRRGRAVLRPDALQQAHLEQNVHGDVEAVLRLAVEDLEGGGRAGPVGRRVKARPRGGAEGWVAPAIRSTPPHLAPRRSGLFCSRGAGRRSPKAGAPRCAAPRTLRGGPPAPLSSPDPLVRPPTRCRPPPAAGPLGPGQPCLCRPPEAQSCPARPCWCRRAAGGKGGRAIRVGGCFPGGGQLPEMRPCGMQEPTTTRA